MAKLKFGTDGVRGRFNEELRVDDVLRLGQGHGYSLRRAFRGAGRPKVVVGRDSRISGAALLGAYGAGLMSQGVDVIDIGVIPTPAVAFAVRHLSLDGAAMLSASHNPVPDNGIKLFGADGKKLCDAEARELEDLVARASELELVDGLSVGRLEQNDTLRHAYRTFLLERLEGKLDGLKIVLDCAHGAASEHAEELFREAGAEVVMLSATPDGEKINVKCGSTDLGPLGDAVKIHQAHFGFAFDGDADRCLAVDETGREVNGDQMMVLMAGHFKREGRLAGNQVVFTVMSNLGAEIALKKLNIEVKRTPVGDRYVYEEMMRGGAVLGGEQSGHILLLEKHWSGDGMLAGLVFAGVVAAADRPLSSLLSDIPEIPQRLVNVSGVDRSKLESDLVVREAIEAAQMRLGSEGRLLVRPSGTEPLIRLMAESPDGDLVDSVLADLRRVVEERLSILNVPSV